MIKMLMICLSFFISNLSASSLCDQIEEDLNPIADHSVTGQELTEWFQELSQTKQVLYCRIRKNRARHFHYKDLTPNKLSITFFMSTSSIPHIA